MQALSTQVSTVQAQPASQHAVATILVSQSPAPSSLPGQSLLADSEPLSRRTSIDETAERVRLIDDTTVVLPKTPVQVEAPTSLQEEAPTPLQEEAPTPEPARATGVPSDLPPVLPEELEDESATDPFDLALTQVSVSMAARGLDVASVPSSEQEQPPSDRPALSLSSLAGTAVLVAGGYRLVLGRSDRIRRRWSPVRFR